MGGTTTDISVLRDGWPVLNSKGANVAGWRTMIEAVDVHTTGLGGDSHVRTDPDRRIIGPRRAVPLCLLASEHPEIVSELRAASSCRKPAATPKPPISSSSRGNRAACWLKKIGRSLIGSPGGRGCWPISAASARAGCGGASRIWNVAAWHAARGFTPTDALHVLGRFQQWNAAAARLGAELLAMQSGQSVEDFCAEVVAAFSKQIATEIVTKIIEDENGRPNWLAEPTAAMLLRRAFDAQTRNGSDLGCTLTLRRPLVAIGAPVAAYLPQVAEMLRTELVIPKYAEVANAVGAVSGSIVQRLHVLINLLNDQGMVRVHLEDGVHDFAHLEAAVAYARRVVSARIEALAREAGAEQVEVRMTQVDHTAPVGIGIDQEIYLGTDLYFTAAGRPSPARRAGEGQ